ncbi:hypothetical protein N7468_003765 [Penicillium chermesinum]|uniref:NACHT-NTPase and P-loop NTPases N-terminal domain-containing protein n=1 Tax=Penicillium chermesinum TaxID=63820 RepID=A0A9W9P700_9EURO|nr:uncharacterized protein N7468_003765 [Penicillium chermesinum]KAJ5239146.1 hypothetical protein N7468_003765 [Penicillium chermesinum]KAJ6164786.1 hypothetical protein N7470_003458 [Penicillium chermesinum]
MDPLAAIGVAGNIITFIDFSYKIFKGIDEVLTTATGMTQANENLSHLAKDFRSVTEDLVSDIIPRTENEKQLCHLATECRTLASRIIQVLESLKLGDDKSAWQGMKVKFQSKKKEKEVESLERQLKGYQSELLIHLQVMFRYLRATKSVGL